MTVGRLCSRDVDSIGLYDSAQMAAHRMRSRNVGTLVVQNDRHEPIGVITDRDVCVRVVAEGLDAATTDVAEFMTEKLETVPEDTPIETALQRMRSDGVRRLLVTDADGRLAGVLSLDDVLELLADEMQDIGRILAKSSPSAATEG